MKLHKNKRSKGFTIIELLVSMAITIILLTIIISVAASSGDILAKAKTKADLSAKSDRVFSILESDIESMVIRRDSSHWFYAGLPYDGAGNTPRYLDAAAPNEVEVAQSGNTITSVGAFAFPSVANLVFYTSVVDSYDGVRDAAGDAGGDVSFVEYQLDFSNMVNSSLDSGISGSVDDNATPQFFRWLEFPDNTFNTLSGSEPLVQVFNDNSVSTGYSEPDKQKAYSVLSTNIYSVSATFNISYTDDSGVKAYGFIALTPHEAAGKYNATGIGIGPNGTLYSDASEYFTGGTAPNYFSDSTAVADFNGMTIDSVNITITMLDQRGLQYLEGLISGDGGFAHMNRDELMQQHSYSFSKTLDFPDY